MRCGVPRARRRKSRPSTDASGHEPLPLADTASALSPGCTRPDCDWDHTSFTSDKVANLQARMEAQTGTSALKFCGDPAVFFAAAAAAAAAASGAGSAGSSVRRGGGGSAIGGGGVHSSPLGGSAFAANSSSGAGSGAGSAGGSGGAHSKRRLDLGRDHDDAGQTPSPRLKKLKRAARARSNTAAGAAAGVESTPTGDGIGNSK